MFDTVTLKCSVNVPGVLFAAAGTLNDPLHVSVLAAIDGFEVVAPDDEPDTYANPAGSVSLIDDSCTVCAFGLLTVIV